MSVAGELTLIDSTVSGYCTAGVSVEGGGVFGADFDANPHGRQDRIDLRDLGITAAGFAAAARIVDLGHDARITVANGGTILLRSRRLRREPDHPGGFPAGLRVVDRDPCAPPARRAR